MRRVGAMHQRANCSGEQHARPGIEDLHRIGAGLQLPHQIARRRLDQHVHQYVESRGIAVGEHPRRRLVRRTTAGDHVGRDRPGRAAKSQQRHSRRQIRLHTPDGLVDRRQHVVIDLRRQPLETGAVLDRIEQRTFAGGKCHRLSERMRHHQDVRKQNRRIESESPHRLQRNLGRELRIENEIEKASGLLAQRAIFRQIASCLAHHPYRRRPPRLAIEHIENGLVHAQDLSSVPHQDNLKILSGGYS